MHKPPQVENCNSKLSSAVAEVDTLVALLLVAAGHSLQPSKHCLDRSAPNHTCTYTTDSIRGRMLYQTHRIDEANPG